MTLSRVRVAWSGTPVTGPGLSTFYFTQSDMTGKPVLLVNFFTAIKNYFPAGITWTIPNAGDIIDEATGELTSVWAASGGGTVLSNGGAADYMPGVGSRVVWATLGITRGRRARGSTFLCPMTEQEITAGVVAPTTRTAIETAANTLVTNAAGLAIWSPPKQATATKPATDGASYAIQSATVPAAMSWLRSRRT